MCPKLALMCAVTALAFMPVLSDPAAANDPDLTYPTGTLLSVTHESGSLIRGTNVGEVLFTNSGSSALMRCATGTMTQRLETNTGTTIEATIYESFFVGTGAKEECTSSFGGITVTTNAVNSNGLPWCLRSTPSMVEDEFQIRGDECTKPSRSITLVLHSTTIGECKYLRNDPLSGVFKTHPEVAVFSLSHMEFPKHEGGMLCPSVGFLDVTYKFEKYGTTEPVYIS
jgi:hypothetical protein